MRRLDSNQRDGSKDRPGSRQNQGPTALGDLLAPRQPRKQSLSGRKPQAPNQVDEMDEPDPGLDPTANIKVNQKSQEETKQLKQATKVIPANLIKPVGAGAPQHRRPSPLARAAQTAQTRDQRTRPARVMVNSSISSIISTTQQKSQQ